MEKTQLIKAIKEILYDYEYNGEDMLNHEKLYLSDSDIESCISEDENKLYFDVGDLDLPNYNICRMSDGFEPEYFDWDEEVDSGWNDYLMDFSDLVSCDRGVIVFNK